MKNCKSLKALALVLIALDVSCFAQGGRDSLTMAMLVPQQAIKFSPLHLINFYPTVELSFEQKIGKQTTLQLEGGYVMDYGDWDEDFIDKRGVKGKLEGRYYFFGRTDRRKIYYLAAEAYANVINFDRLTVDEGCFDIECNHTFLRQQAYKVEYREQGFTLKVGLMKYFYRQFFFDMNSGWTIRDIEYRKPAIISRTFGEWTFWEIPNEEKRTILSPNVGFRFGYRLR